ncbi:MAG: type II toxin-antitoxin system VapC family toxin [Terriglobales bacterium]
MKRFVVDASVSLSWFVDRPVSLYAVQVKQELLAGAQAVVPSLWHAEMANGLIVAERKRVLTASDVSDCLRDLEILQAHAIETSSRPTTLRQALTLARAFQLSAYDALYLDAARAEELPLATLDRALRDAAPRAGVELLR